jgi:signal transduction histidine kinase
VSRIESSDVLPLYPEPFDLNLLVSDAARNVDLTAPGFNWTLDLAAAPVQVNADPHLIGEVMTNLLENAVKYSGDSNRIEVAVAPNGKEVVTSVRDYGVGIPTAQQKQVFDRSYRASNATSLPRNGLGLFLAREIVTRHGGRIWCESIQDVGSTFYFSLPLA